MTRKKKLKQSYRNKDTRYLEKVAEDKRKLRNFFIKESINKLGRKFNMVNRDKELKRLDKLHPQSPHARILRRHLGLEDKKGNLIKAVEAVVEETAEPKPKKEKAKKKSIFKK